MPSRDRDLSASTSPALHFLRARDKKMPTRFRTGTRRIVIHHAARRTSPTRVASG
jgi:hypothetical protein